jgi:hypothetical protein
MTLDRKAAIELYDQAKCQGEFALFSSPNREAYRIAAIQCAKCPVKELCLMHVEPETGFTGTAGGRLWYDGIDVTDKPDTLPPPVYRENDVDPDLAVEINEAFKAEDADWSIYSESTLMAAIWRLRKHGYRASRISRVSGISKERIIQLTEHFEEEASPDLKDFVKDA